jgi:hypothetical protein
MTRIVARKDAAALFRAVRGFVAGPARQSCTADLGDQTPCPHLRHLRDRERDQGTPRRCEVGRPYPHRNDEIGPQARASGSLLGAEKAEP